MAPLISTVVFLVRPSDFSDDTLLIWAKLGILMLIALLTAPLAGKLSEKVAYRFRAKMFWASYFCSIVFGYKLAILALTYL